MEIAFLLTYIIVLIIVMGVGFILSAVTYVAEAFPLYKLAKKTGRKNAWFAWMPIFGAYFRLYTLMDIAGDKEVVLFSEKYTIKSRPKSYLIFVGGSLALDLVIVAVILLSMLLLLIPIVGIIIFMIVVTIASLLGYASTIALAVIRYVYFKDVLDIFREDKNENNTTAILVVLLDLFVTGGLARIIFLYTLLGRDPLPEEVSDEMAEDIITEEVAEASAETETVSV